MRKHPVYLAFGLLLIGLVTAAELRGWTTTRATEVRNVPRSVRENPGSYRGVYVGRAYPRGK